MAAASSGPPAETDSLAGEPVNESLCCSSEPQTVRQIDEDRKL